MKELTEKLKDKVLVGDGAMGTSLQAKGLKSGETPESWNEKKPQIVKDVHKSYVNAGSNILITNTFGATKYKLEIAGYPDKVDYFNKKGAELALDSSDGNAYVLGGLGPCGKFVKPYGDVEFGDLYTNFKEQVFALKDTGIHGFIMETMTDINELEAATLAVKDCSNLPLISSMTFQEIEPGVFKTMMGVGMEQFVNKVIELGGNIIGTNCGNGSNLMLNIVKQMKEITQEKGEENFIMAQPNAGNPTEVEGITKFDETPEDFRRIIPEYLDVGINIIGGCCGTTSEHIRVIREIVDQDYGLRGK